MKSILLAFAMFSRLPVPRAEFREENMRHLMAAFPLVGVAVGLSAAGWEWAGAALGLGPFLRGAGFALLPIAVSGGIHMDGLCDTADALASNGDAEKMQRILKDPHAGSFAGVAAAAYILLFAALAGEGFAGPGLFRCFALSFVLSRCLAGLAVIAFPGSPRSTLARHFNHAAARKTSMILLLSCLALLCALMTRQGGAAGLAAFAAPLALFPWCGRIAAKRFGGMGGDLSGCLLQLCELASLAAIVVVPRIQGAL